MNLSSLLTECLHQQLNAGCVGGQSWTYSRVDAHVRQHPDQLHQHVLILPHTHRRGRRLAGGRGTFPWGCARWVVSALVAVVQLQERLHAALALKELLPSLVAFGCEVPEGEKKPHDKVLWESGGKYCSGQPASVICYLTFWIKANRHKMFLHVSSYCKCGWKARLCWEKLLNGFRHDSADLEQYFNLSSARNK